MNFGARYADMIVETVPLTTWTAALTTLDNYMVSNGPIPSSYPLKISEDIPFGPLGKP